MKKHPVSLLVTLTAVFAAFLLGLTLGRSSFRQEVLVQLPPAMTVPATTAAMLEETTAAAIAFPIDLNTATQEELMALPGIGPVLAEEILAYRQAHGSFSCPEELLNVPNIGEKRLEAIWDLIHIGG